MVAAVGAVALAAAVVAVGPGAAPSGAEVVPGSGTATNYASDGGGGNCSYPSGRTGGLDVALSEVEYGTADACGGFLDVTGPGGTVRVEITNRCPECQVGHLDLSQEAFARIAPIEAGQVDVTYSLVRDPDIPSPIALRVKDGSSRWWMQIQAIDHGNPIASFELQQADGSWRRLTHSQDNFWTAEEPGPGDGPFTVRITDVYGQATTVADVALAPNQVQRTEARLYGPGAGAAAPPTTAPPPPPTTAPPTTAAPTTAPPTTAPSTTAPATTASPPAGPQAAAVSRLARDSGGGSGLVPVMATAVGLALAVGGTAAFVAVRRRTPKLRG